MPWRNILEIDPGPTVPLRQRIDGLFAQQRATWPALRDGEAALAHLQRKTLSTDISTVIVQRNPARRGSTLAKTDAKAVAARACFLCPDKMPAEERGVAFEDFVVLPNPFPILPLHATIASRDHQPQRIMGRVDAYLRLARDLSPDLAALYNGPRCGASAPDHLHFQAAVASEIPILAQFPPKQRRPHFAHTSRSRRMVVFAGADPARIPRDVDVTIAALAELDPSDAEPMLNLIARFDGRQYLVVLFPRAAHRPVCYFQPEPDQILISPAILEMCGIVVATEEAHYSRVDDRVVEEIYKEVSLAGPQFERLIAALSIGPR